MPGLGDYYRALAALRPDADDARAIAGMLGVDLAGAVAVPRAEMTVPIEAKRVVAPVDAAVTAAPEEPYVGFSVTSMRSETDDRPRWLAEATPLPVERTKYRAPKLPFAPLIPQNKVRALLATLLATPVEEGPLDVPRLISAIARAEPLTQLYRQRSMTVRRGAQVLVDRGEAMSLFARDARWLTRELQNVIGIPRVELLLFADCPSRGAGGPEEDEWHAYRAPASGTPILLLTDFGIGAEPAARATSSEWAQFFAAARAASCPVLVLVPYAGARWPAELAARVTGVVWDNASTVQMARRAAAASRRRKVS